MTTQTKTAEKADNGPAQLPTVKPPLTAGGTVTAIIPRDIDQAYRMATAITAADMAPKSFERNTDRVLVAIMHGMEVGLTPMAAVQSIAVINGTPSIWGDGALGLVLGSGLVEDMDEHMEMTEDGKAEIGAICTIKRKGRKTPIVGRFTWEDVETANLTKKQGPWQQYPKRMIKMRARAFALRDGFADVLKGLHIGEEVQDYAVLTPGAGGVYEPGPRPERSNYEPAKPAEKPAASEPYEIYDHVGEAFFIYDAHEATDQLVGFLNNCPDDHVEVLADSNATVLARMEDEGSGIAELYRERLAEVTAPVEPETPEATEATKPEPAAEEPDDEPYRVAVPIDEKKGKSNWQKYRNDYKARIAELSASEEIVSVINRMKKVNGPALKNMKAEAKPWFETMGREIQKIIEDNAKAESAADEAENNLRPG